MPIDTLCEGISYITLIFERSFFITDAIRHGDGTHDAAAIFEEL